MPSFRIRHCPVLVVELRSGQGRGAPYVSASWRCSSGRGGQCMLDGAGARSRRWQLQAAVPLRGLINHSGDRCQAAGPAGLWSRGGSKGTGWRISQQERRLLWFPNWCCSPLIPPRLCSRCIHSAFLLQASKEVRGNYKNLADCVVGIVKAKGLGGLYCGFFASLAVSAPSTAVFATGYEFAKNALEKTAASHPLGGVLQPCAPILAASFGNIFSSVVRVPPEVVKQQVQTGMYRDVFEATNRIWVQNGVAGFYRGYSSMVLRDIPYAALQFMTFEALKKQKAIWLEMQKRNSQTGEVTKPHNDLALNLCIGAIAGAVASVLTTPLDVVKTRIMTERTLTGLVSGGMRSTMKRIWVEEGLHGFGRGMAPRVLYKVPASAIFLMCYEVTKKLFRARNMRSTLSRNSPDVQKSELRHFIKPRQNYTEKPTSIVPAPHGS